MSEAYLLGIDIGTSGCKSILIDSNGNVIGTALREYPLYTPRAGWAEQDPEDWWNAVISSISEVLNNTAVAKQAIKGIGLSGQMHGLVAIDSDGNVLRPAILWNDQRTQVECDAIQAKAGGLQALLKLTNNPMLTGYTGGKILWMREHEPELYGKIRYILNPKDYIRYRLSW